MQNSNHIPTAIKNKLSLNQFKRMLKEYLVDKVLYLVEEFYNTSSWIFISTNSFFISFAILYIVDTVLVAKETLGKPTSI